MKITVVIPAYNEERLIGSVVKDVAQYVDDVVVVNDGSRDATSREAERAGAIVLSHPINRGYGAALHTGSIWAIRQGAGILIHFDADGQHQASDIPNFIASLSHSIFDVALGSRFIESKHTTLPYPRYLLLKCALFFTRVVHRVHVTDTHNGLRAFTAKAYSCVDISQDRMAYASEILSEIKRNNLSFTEVSTTIRYSEYSKAKGQTWVDAFRIMWQLIRGRLFR